MIEREQVASLKAKHRELEAQLEVENTRPYLDEVLVNNLKRQKLRIKDELASMNEL